MMPQRDLARQSEEIHAGEERVVGLVGQPVRTAAEYNLLAAAVNFGDSTEDVSKRVP